MLGLAGAVAVLGLTAVLGLGIANARQAEREEGTELILRLPDLPRGYLVDSAFTEWAGNPILCTRLDPPDRRRQVARFVARFRPAGCAAFYYRLFQAPGEDEPLLVASGALPLESRAAADAGWRLAPLLLAQLLDNHRPKEVAAPGRLGRATRLFHTNDPPLFSYFKPGRRASLLVWRSGNKLAAVVATGDSFATLDRAALELARRQQAHIRRPTPYADAERFDGDVALDDPRLTEPVYWLGKSFSPGRGLPDTGLRGAYSPLSYGLEESIFAYEEEAPGLRLGIIYGSGGDYGDFSLYDWTAARWPEYGNSRAGRAIVTWHCTRKRRIELPAGQAVIYGGYAKNYRRCPTGRPDAFTAHAYFGDLVIVVDPVLRGQIDEIESRHSPYSSFRSMEAILRGLRPHPRPTY